MLVMIQTMILSFVVSSVKTETIVSNRLSSILATASEMISKIDIYAFELYTIIRPNTIIL